MKFAVLPRDIALFVLVALIWGFNFAVAKIGLIELPPIFMIALRFALVAAILIPFVPRPHGRWRDVLLLSTTLGFLHFACMFTGLSGLDAATASIAIQLQVPFASLLAAISFGDRLGWRRATGMAVAFLGVAIIAGEPRLAGNYGYLALVLIAAMIWAISNIQVKKLSELSGWTISAWFSLFAVPQLLIGSYFFEQGQWQALTHASPAAIGSVVYQALIVVIVGYGIWYWLLRRYEVNQAMPFTLLVPLAGVASGILVLGEPLTTNLVIGGVCTILGVGVITIRRPATTAPNVERV